MACALWPLFFSSYLLCVSVPLWLVVFEGEHRIVEAVEDLGGVGGGHGGAEAVVAGCATVVVEIDPVRDGRSDEAQHLFAVVSQGVAGLRGAIAEAGVSVLLSEQNFRSVVELTSRVCVIERGAVVREVTTAELGASQDLQRELLGVGRRAMHKRLAKVAAKLKKFLQES